MHVLSKNTCQHINAGFLSITIGAVVGAAAYVRHQRKEGEKVKLGDALKATGAGGLAGACGGLSAGLVTGAVVGSNV